MECPICSHADTRVVDSRLSTDGNAVRRRRECAKCQYRFSTLEEIELLDLTIVKRDGRHEAYVREKMERGLRKALEKRSYTDSDFRSLVHGVERDLQRKKLNEIRSSDVGEIVMDRLKQFDKVAYIRFASVYRSFEDVQTFQKELAGLLRPSTKNRKGKKSRGRKAGG